MVADDAAEADDVGTMGSELVHMWHDWAGVDSWPRCAWAHLKAPLPWDAAAREWGSWRPGCLVSQSLGV